MTTKARNPKPRRAKPALGDTYETFRLEAGGLAAQVRDINFEDAVKLRGLPDDDVMPLLIVSVEGYDRWELVPVRKLRPLVDAIYRELFGDGSSGEAPAAPDTS